MRENKEEHDKLFKLLLGNGEVGLLEQARNHTKAIEEHEEEIEFIKNHYTRRKEDKKESKWDKMPLYQKIITILVLLSFFNIEGIFNIIKMLLK